MEDKNKNVRVNRSRGFKLTLAVGAMLAGFLSPNLTALGDDVSTTQPSHQMPPDGGEIKGFITGGLDANGAILMAPNQTRKITTSRKAEKVNILAPDIADYVLLSPTETLITPKKAGTTQLIIWDESHHAQVVDLVVQSDIVKLIKELKDVFPHSEIAVTEINGAIALRGHMKDLKEADEAVQISAPYAASGKVLNFLDVAGGQQIMLQVRFAEVSKTAAANLGINFGFSDGTSFVGNNVGNVNPFIMSGTGVKQALTGVGPASAVAIFGQGMVAKEAFQYFIQAMRSNNVLRMLAEPDLVTTSGQEADFLAGGEFPIPVSQGSGSGGAAITVDYKEFGIKLKFLPVMMGDGHIRIAVSPESSQLDYSTAVQLNGFVVPGLTTRRVNTTVDLVDGQTFAIAGLLSSSYSANVNEFPGLGDIPVLGALFRSVQYQRSETELVVMVTPMLVHGMDPVDVKPIPAAKWRYPNEMELFFLKDLGGEAPDTSHAPTGSAPRFHGAFGFQPPVQPAGR